MNRERFFLARRRSAPGQVGDKQLFGPERSPEPHSADILSRRSEGRVRGKALREETDSIDGAATWGGGRGTGGVIGCASEIGTWASRK